MHKYNRAKYDIDKAINLASTEDFDLKKSDVIKIGPEHPIRHQNRIGVAQNDARQYL